ncbi:translation initiation factor 2 [Lysinibacillus sp. KU-BSD001]|uniref:hypothetical protein n=1 Tax=Lysinibacillus sp. KU-BSD001 TaxID=3141328 RepID=UPI0036EAC992
MMCLSWSYFVDMEDWLMNNEKDSSLNNQILDAESQAARLAIIASTISIFGESLGTIAAALALEEAEQKKANNNKDMETIKKQLDYLTYEMKQIKKRLR